ncbi:MAG: hypothetical protein ACLSVD_03490 [Eggerthellaceae bacterium]
MVDAINRAARTRFVYIGAPAGSGKTVSALLWIRKVKQPTVWIGLDRYDDVPSVFYKQLATGLYSVRSTPGLCAPCWRSGVLVVSVQYHQPRSEMLPLEKRHVLVFDDMHFIKNREIAKSLADVLRRLPGAFSAAVASQLEENGARLTRPASLRCWARKTCSSAKTRYANSKRWACSLRLTGRGSCTRPRTAGPSAWRCRSRPGEGGRQPLSVRATSTSRYGAPGTTVCVPAWPPAWLESSTPSWRPC